MKSYAIVLCLAATATLAAQTASKPSAPAAQSSSAATKSSTTTAASAAGYKLPPGTKRIPTLPKNVLTGWRYQDIVIGKGAEGESGKMWHMKYKGWRAADGVVFDSWENNKRPQMKDGKPVMGPDNKPVMGDPEPLAFPQGAGRLIPGFDWAVAGMHVGGKRRIFIPWELAYGTRAIPDRPDHPGIPAKSDLIFDVELVDLTDMPAMPQRPMMAPPRPGAPPQPTPHPGAPATPGTTPPSGAPGTTPPPSGQPATPPPAGAPSTPPTTAPAPGTQPNPTTTTPNPGTQPQTQQTPPPTTPQK